MYLPLFLVVFITFRQKNKSFLFFFVLKASGLLEYVTIKLKQAQMANSGNPTQHTTRTTAPSNIKVQTNLRYDTSYIRRQAGVLKVVEIVSLH